MIRPRWILPQVHNLPQCIYICWCNSEWFIDKVNLSWWIK